MNEKVGRENRIPMIDWASEALGGRALAASDEFFAPKENLLKPGRGVFIPDRYTDRGKWMDGWETRRRRQPGHDWCIIRLGLPARLRTIEVDTNHFLGNFPEYASVDGLCLEKEPPLDVLTAPEQPWHPLVPVSRLKGGHQNRFDVRAERRFTHLRLNIFPDGGVARFRAFGDAAPDWTSVLERKEAIDLAAIEWGGRIVRANDMFFSPGHNLIMPGPPLNMGDGWETRRRRRPGFDWIVIRLGRPGIIQRLEIDTTHFKGNHPESCRVEGAVLGDCPPDFFDGVNIAWRELLPRVPLEADRRHVFSDELLPADAYTHLRLCIFPDGGVARFRAIGVPLPSEE